MYYNDDREDKKDMDDMYDAENYEQEDEENDEEEEEDSSQDAGQMPGKGSMFKGAKNFLGKAGKTIKKVATIIAKLPLPVKIALMVAITGIITYIILEVNKEAATAGVTNSTNNTVASMNSEASDLKKKKEEGTITSEEEKKLEKLEKAIEQFNGKNSYLYFTISNINDAYDDFVSEYKGSTNDVQSRNYKSLSTEFGDVELAEELKNERIVDSNQKLPLYIHLLMTEKYNFNAVKWKWYGHGRDGEEITEANMTLDKELGLKYPNDGTTKIETFVDLLSPYMLTWHIPLGFHSGFLTKSGSDKQASNFTYSIVKNAYSDIVAHRYDIQTYTLRTKFEDYYENKYYSRFNINITVTYEYEAQTEGENSYEVDTSGKANAQLITTKKVYLESMSYYDISLSKISANNYEIIATSSSDTSAIENTKNIIFDEYKSSNKNQICVIANNGNISMNEYSKFSNFSGDNNEITVVDFSTLYDSGIYIIRYHVYKANVKVLTSQVYKKKDGKIIYNKYVKYSYNSTPHILDSRREESGEYSDEKGKYVNTISTTTPNTKDSIDVMKEEKVSENTTIKNSYYISKAKAFDVTIANTFNYIKYSESDAMARKNPKSESVNYEDYTEELDTENKISTGDQIKANYFSKSISQLENELNVIDNGLNVSNQYTNSVYQDIKDLDVNTRKLLGETTETGLANNVPNYSTNYDYLNSYENKSAYIVRKGLASEKMGIHNITRVWKDTLTQNKSETNTFTEKDLVTFNAEYNANLNGTSVADEEKKYQEIANKSESSYSMYKSLAATKMLTTIDFVNSNSNIYNEYLIGDTPQSKIMGYNREYLKFALEEVKRLFKETEDKNGTIPYVYGVSLGFTKILSEKKATELNSSSGLFCWPTDNEYISCIQGYSARYNDVHGGIDIWASYTNENDMNHAWNSPSAPVYAAAGGKIIVASDIGAANGDRVSASENGGCGNYIVIKHDNGYITEYMHLSTGTFSVAVGDTVQKGQQLALIGSSGNSSCMHLHFSIYDNSDGNDSYTENDRLDPLEFYKIEVNEERNPEKIEFIDVLNDENLRNKINNFNMFKYAGTLGNGEVIADPLPELSDSEKDELVSELNGSFIYNKISTNRPSDIQNLWVLQYYSDNPIELLARAMYAEMVVSDSSNEAGVYAIAAQMKATLNHIGDADKIYSNFTDTGYLAFTTFISSNFTTNNLPQFYRQMAAAVLEGELPNPPGFNGDEMYWIGSSDYIRPDGTSNHFAYNNGCIQTCGFSPNGSSFHVFLAGRQGATGLLQKSSTTCANGNRFKMNDNMKIAENVYVNEAAGGSVELNYDEIIEVINKY